MDGGRRLDQPLMRPGSATTEQAGALDQPGPAHVYDESAYSGANDTPNRTRAAATLSAGSLLSRGQAAYGIWLRTIGIHSSRLRRYCAASFAAFRPLIERWSSPFAQLLLPPGFAFAASRFDTYRASMKRRVSRFGRLPPRGLGIAASILLLAATLAYGVVAGDHVGAIVDWFKDVRDAAANAAGFRIAAISLAGPKEVSREEVLTIAGVTGRASLLFLDADAARARLLANPWIADAAVLKLYPDRLQITITERQAFALWQKDGRVSVIAADGTVLEPFVEDRYVGLPLVVGRSAQQHARDFLAVIGRYPAIRSVLRASVLVAERRWNLRLKNGIDVRLPEANVEEALDRLIALDREKKLLSRDIVSVDLRLPDRVSVRLSDAAAQTREDALKSTKKKKGGDA